MRNDASLINISGNTCADEGALAKKLKDNPMFYYGCDATFLENEP